MTPNRLIAFLLAAFAAVPLFAQTASFTGVVRNEAGKALGDMTVQAYNPAGFPVTALTDSQGRYLLVVSPGTYRLVAYDNAGNYAVHFHGGANSFETSEAINVTAGQQVMVDFRLQAGQPIRGLVRTSANVPLEGAVVAAYNLDGSRRTFVTTNADGTYTLTVPAGSYKVVAYHERSAYIPVFFRNEKLFEEATVVTPPAGSVDFFLTRGTRVSGVVREAPLGIPLSNISVVAYDLQGQVQYRTNTNPAGEFAFVLPTNQPFKFAVEDSGGNFQTTFFRNATSFASAATIVANTAAPQLEFAVNHVADDAPSTTLFIPGIIHAQNQTTNTFFKTDVWIQNPGEGELTVEATFLPAGQDNSAATGVPVTVPARGQIVLADIVRTFFGTTGAGALRLDAGGPFRATSRTFNEPPNALVVGTFGLSIPAQSIGESLGRATLTGLVQNTNSRTNIGLMNPQPVSITVNIDVFSQTGALLGNRTVTLRPGEWVQPPVAETVLTPFDQAYAVVSSQDGSFFSYAAVVDGKSGDGTFILPSPD